MNNIYYVFKPATWKSENIYAKIKNVPPKLKPHWWAGSPMLSQLPPVSFVVKPEWDFPDNFLTETIFDLYSSKLIKILDNAKIGFEAFPASLVDEVGNDLRVEYRIFHLLEKYSCLDRKLSEINLEMLEIKKIVLDKEFLSSKKLLFRVEELSHIVLVHQDLKDALERQGITGCEYTLLSEYRSMPIRGGRYRTNLAGDVRSHR